MRTITSPHGTVEEAKEFLDGLSLDRQDLRIALDALVELSHAQAASRGWWHDWTDGAIARNVGELLCLMHSELSEAMEGARKDLPSDHVPGLTMVEEELADLLLRVFDFAGAAGLRLGLAFISKLAFNASREDHGPEARAGKHGKKF